MLIFGAVGFAAALSQAGRFLGYRVTVCDARPVFATPPVSRTRTRSSSTGPTATSGPPRWTPAPRSASSPTTPSSASLRTDFGAHTPEETAISITAEIIAHTHHGTGRSLSNGTGPIHPAHDRPLAAMGCAGRRGTAVGPHRTYRAVFCSGSFRPTRTSPSSPATDAIGLLEGAAEPGQQSRTEALRAAGQRARGRWSADPIRNPASPTRPHDQEMKPRRCCQLAGTVPDHQHYRRSARRLLGEGARSSPRSELASSGFSPFRRS